MNFLSFTKVVILLLITNFTFLGKAQEIKVETKPSVEYLDKSPLNNYIIGEGDQIKIIVSRDLPQITDIYTVDVSGMIYLPNLHRVFVSGLTISELNQLLTQRFSEYVKNPFVECQIVKYRPVKVFVDGEVDSPGFYILSGTSENSLSINSFDSNNSSGEQNYLFPSVFDAIRKAGGISRYADLSQIKLIRKQTITEGGGQKYTTLNFARLFEDNAFSENIRIFDGDIIKIEKSNTDTLKEITKLIKYNINPKFMNVYVSGKVKNPGTIRVPSLASLSDAISLAGGKKVISGDVVLVRYLNDGNLFRKVIKYKFNSKPGSRQNPYLASGDIISIKMSPISTANEVIDEVTKPIVGVYSTIALFKLLN